MIPLRPYQETVCAAARDGWRQWRKQILVLPTGSGKTICFAHLAAGEQPGKTLILAHRKELIDQAIAKIQAATGIYAQKEMADFSASLTAPIVVASIQTMRCRLEKWPFDHFELIVADEAHHTLADEWQTVLQHFDGHARVLGVTATPDRGDKRNLGAYFENIAAEISLFQLINEGWLSRIVVKALPLKIDLAGVRSTAGDYDSTDLDAALSPYLAFAAQALKEHATGRHILAFLPLIHTSKDFVRECQAAGLRAMHVDGTSEERHWAPGALARGEIDLISNAQLYSEGFDCPEIDCILPLRPTRSRAFFSQMVGRGTRLATGKKNLLLLDFLWQSQKHNLIRPAHLVAPSEELAGDMTEMLADEAFGADQDELDLEGLVSRASFRREQKLRDELAAKSRREAMACDAMDFCLSIHALAAAEWEDMVSWHSLAPSEKQLALIKNAGIHPDSIKSRGHASAVIDLIQTRRRLNLASPKQVRLLRRFKTPSPETVSKEEASKIISEKFGGWKTAATTTGWTGTTPAQIPIPTGTNSILTTPILSHENP